MLRSEKLRIWESSTTKTNKQTNKKTKKQKTKPGLSKPKIYLEKTGISKVSGFRLQTSSLRQGHQIVLMEKPQRDSSWNSSSHNVMQGEVVRDFPQWHTSNLSGSSVIWWFKLTLGQPIRRRWNVCGLYLCEGFGELWSILRRLWQSGRLGQDGVSAANEDLTHKRNHNYNLYITWHIKGSPWRVHMGWNRRRFVSKPVLGR